MKYYIIGYPGSGKTTLAKWLSKETGVPFIDIDSIISETMNMSVSEIFEKEGEEFFRKLESQTLKDLDYESIIVSCGGGLPCYDDNMDWMLEHGKVIWLDTPLETIKERIIRDGIEKRPLMAKMAENGNLNEYIDKQYKERELYYKKANIRIR